ncbi:hypothetical protein PRIPAC_79560 [Pristionchus pacificus]|uniref:Uncharacterized protein n=1 Tax=Pristionchus pacificus TaxID=54126 RepID=A0A2A6BH15_PRIPA|nr:hypothetical protein PRIPAC_79560 [Pristionchus pacificus]|eukprot:PDM65190.1 hypothetical protein PRIPAC_52132 [Pristionchus pacificus]
MKLCILLGAILLCAYAAPLLSDTDGHLIEVLKKHVVIGSAAGNGGNGGDGGHGGDGGDGNGGNGGNGGHGGNGGNGGRKKRQVIVNCAPGGVVTKLPLGEVEDEIATERQRDKRQVIINCGVSGRRTTTTTNGYSHGGK